MFLKNCNFLRKIPDLKACNVIKKRLQLCCFPLNIAKFLKTPFSQNTSGQLLSFGSLSSLFALVSTVQQLPLFSYIREPLLSNVAWISENCWLVFSSSHSAETLIKNTFYFQDFIKILQICVFSSCFLILQPIVPEMLLSFLSSVLVDLSKYLSVTKQFFALLKIFSLTVNQILHQMWNNSLEHFVQKPCHQILRYNPKTTYFLLVQFSLILF